MNRILKTGALLACSAVVATSVTGYAQTRVVGGVAVPVSQTPGLYEMFNRADVEKNRIDWSMSLQKQDHDQYVKATTEVDAAYTDFYNNGLIGLRRIYNDTSIAKNRMGSPAELASAIDAFVTRRDQFEQKLAALETVSEVWQGLQSQQPTTQKENDQVLKVYQRGSLNLKALTDKYREAISKMTTEAAGYTYTISNGATALVTPAGSGLVKIGSVETPDFIKQKLAIFKAQARMTQEDQEQVGRIALEIKRHMTKFTDATDLKLYWFNTLQEQQRKAWTESLQKYARVANYARGVYCMPIGVPALDLPKLQKFNVGYLTRDVKSRIRFVNTAEFDSAAMRSILMRFDEWFVSLQSQNGEFDEVGGLMGYVHRANSTFAWHNEVQAYITVAKILRDMYVDEIDVATEPVAGCARVRERYNARYGSFKDAAFLAEAQRFLEGTVTADPAMQSFNAAGSVIIAKGQYAKEYYSFLKKNPTASTLGRSVMEDDDLK